MTERRKFSEGGPLPAGFAEYILGVGGRLAMLRKFTDAELADELARHVWVKLPFASYADDVCGEAIGRLAGAPPGAIEYYI